MNSLALITSGYISIAGSVTAIEAEPSILDIEVESPEEIETAKSIGLKVEEEEKIANKAIDIEIESEIEIET